ncbi:MAG: phage baseplate assembly protein [Alphaproteobacteria bacterium]|nr:phage baseplate assembly protein [Alphaproteobacteria bacterium]
MDAVMRTVGKLIAPLKRRVLLMIGRGVIKLIDDAGGIQHVQLVALEGETLDRVERFQEYGFTSAPHPGAEAVLAAAAGDRAHSLVVGVEDRRYRLTGLAGGEVAIYDDLGQVIKLARTGIEVTTGQSAGVTVNAPVINANVDKVVVNSNDIHLAGEGGAQIARVGDLVAVGTGSSAGNWPIISGSDKARCL